jgi:hypothetical protein
MSRYSSSGEELRSRIIDAIDDSIDRSRSRSRSPVRVVDSTRSRSPVRVVDSTRSRSPVRVVDSTRSRSPVRISPSRSPVRISPSRSPVRISPSRSPVRVVDSTRSRSPVRVVDSTRSRSPVRGASPYSNYTEYSSSELSNGYHSHQTPFFEVPRCGVESVEVMELKSELKSLKREVAQIKAGLSKAVEEKDQSLFGRGVLSRSPSRKSPLGELVKGARLSRSPSRSSTRSITQGKSKVGSLKSDGSCAIPRSNQRPSPL